MLNLKKGLAIALAAATVITFAPVNALASAVTIPGTSVPSSDTVASDGLTQSAEIDSKPGNTVAPKNNVSPALWIKEHDDKSNNNSTVQAFKVTVSRHAVAGTNTYEDGVELQVAKNNASGTTFAPVNRTNTAAATTVSSGLARANDVTGADSTSNLLDYSTFIIDNIAPTKDSNQQFKDLGGVWIQFKGLVVGTYDVSVSSLDSNEDNATVLDTSTFKVTVPSKAEAFSLAKSQYTVTEDSYINIAYQIANYAGSIKYVDIESDNPNVVSLVSDWDADKTTKGKISNQSVTKAVGNIRLYAQGAGEAQVTFLPKTSTTDETGKEVTADITVNPANGKLYVSYQRQSDGRTVTYTDDYTAVGSSLENTKQITSSKKSIGKDGKLVIDSDPYKYKGYGEKDWNTGNGTIAIGQNSVTAEYKSLSDTQIQSLSWNFITGTTNDPARTLISEGDKTIQINAHSDVPGAELSYNLVRQVADTDTYYTSNNGTVTSKADTGISEQAYLESTTNATKHIISLGHRQVGPDTKLNYTTAAAQKYGSVDTKGLVTLKRSLDDSDPLYVVVTAKKGNDVLSTILVPLNLESKQPIKLYVASQNYFVEEEGGDWSTTYNTRADYAIYMNLTDHSTDKLNIWTNAGGAYYTGSSDNADIAEYSNATQTITAKKAGTTYIRVTTQAAPNVDGIKEYKIKVVVNDKASNGEKLGYQTVAVSKNHPNDSIKATSTVKGANVIYDTDNLYMIDSSLEAPQDKYRAITPDDPGYKDITISSSGNVAYQRNAGTVYVRAYASATDKTNPSGWTYIPVTYGENVAANTLSVDKTALIIKKGDTATVNATANTAISLKSDDPTVATVASAGAIQVTGVKQGTTSIEVTAAADASKGIAEKTISIPVVVTDENNNTAEVTKPEKVTGLKVTNLKGGKVKVTWTKQNQKNIKYYVKKTVGKKSAGKSVGSNKTTLSVKKGATVKVKVKAYIYDVTGKKLVGSYSKTVTKKTDKK